MEAARQVYHKKGNPVVDYMKMCMSYTVCVVYTVCARMCVCARNVFQNPWLVPEDLQAKIKQQCGEKEAWVKISTMLSRSLASTNIAISQGTLGFHHCSSSFKNNNRTTAPMKKAPLGYVIWCCIWLTTNTSFPTLVQGKSYSSCLTEPTFCNTEAQVCGCFSTEQQAHRTVIILPLHAQAERHAFFLIHTCIIIIFFSNEVWNLKIPIKSDAVKLPVCVSILVAKPRPPPFPLFVSNRLRCTCLQRLLIVEEKERKKGNTLTCSNTLGKQWLNSVQECSQRSPASMRTLFLPHLFLPSKAAALC